MPDMNLFNAYYRIGADRLAAQTALASDLTSRAFNLLNLGFAVGAAGVIAILRSDDVSWDDLGLLWSAGLAVVGFIVLLCFGVVAIAIRSWATAPSPEDVDHVLTSNDDNLTRWWLTRYFRRAEAANEAELDAKSKVLWIMAVSLAIETGATLAVVGVATVGL